MKSWILAASFAAGAWTTTAHADETAATKNAAETTAGDKAARVRAGPTSVTVIDENESVDDVISRVRRTREASPRGEAKPNPPPQDAVADKDPGLRKEAALRKDARKEVREKVRERRQERRRLKERTGPLRPGLERQ